MKIKMVKMGMDIDETRNHRIRGIIPTKDGKYLFIDDSGSGSPGSCGPDSGSEQ